MSQESPEPESPHEKESEEEKAVPTEDAPLEETPSQEDTQEKTPSEESLPEEIVSEENKPEEKPSEEVSPEKALPHEDSLEESSPKEDPPEEESLPTPNIQDGDGSATYGNETSMARRTKDWGIEYEHPLDRFNAAPKQRGLGFFGCLFLGIALAALCFILIAAVLGWATTGRFVQKGYEVVRLTDREAVIAQSPGLPTCYIGRSIDVRIPKCQQPISVIGTNVTIRGDFISDVSLTAFKLHATKQARFARDLEIYAGEFRDESATLLGTRKGMTLREIIPPENP